MPYTSPATVVDSTVAPASWGNSVKAAVDYLANPLSCRAKRTTTQSVPNTTATPIQLTGEDWDTGALHDNATLNTRVILKAVGLWRIEAGVMFASGAAGARDAWLLLNNLTRIDEVACTAAAADLVSFSLATTVKATAITDYVELVTFQASGGAVNVVATLLSPYISATWVGLG
jgi:hypothetical protein